MPTDPPDTPSDARLIGQAVRSVRRARNLTAIQAATAMNLPLRTYEYFEGGTGRVNLDHVRRFAAVADADPYALLVGPEAGSTELARRTADSKLMLIFLQALGGRLQMAFMERAALDEIEIYLMPELIGGGRPLFPATGLQATLRLLSAQTLDRGCVRLHYSL